MPVIQFDLVCRDIALRETKAVRLINDNEIPDGVYQFEEMFCDNPQCDCREAIIVVYEQNLGDVPLATFLYRWEAADFYGDHSGVCRICRSGAELMQDGDQSAIAEPLLDLFAESIADKNYVRTISRHYRLFKAAVAGKRDETGPKRKAPKTRKRLDRLVG